MKITTLTGICFLLSTAKVVGNKTAGGFTRCIYGRYAASSGETYTNTASFTNLTTPATNTLMYR